ncbi:ArnT family glycosyltransferase [Sinomonas susongensis]|uniref:ArnT family glycosyltransferase n=1 Tax=Sinomonas susongensis TaxID=1324851 RepID=UPI001BB21BD4|nr:glycosyltransferase family 39 protein [Sinomonas susongensis]
MTPGIAADDASHPRRRELLLLAGVLAANAGLNFWNLGANGWANAFYTAAVQSGLHNGEALLFGSSDWGNSISVDKPPLSLWLMGLSVRVLGFNSWGILVPQALLGVATTALIYWVVRRRARPAAALASAFTYATTPVVVLLSRYNNPDPLLIFLTVLALEATLRGLELRSVRQFAIAGLLLGLGFLTKQFQVLLVVPALAIACLSSLGSGRLWMMRSALAATAAFVAVAGGWLAFVDLTPAAMRPYAGGSASNSLTELTLGYNGLNRITSTDDLVSGLIPPQFAGSGGDDSGWLRLFNANFNQEASWLLALAFLCGVTAAWSLRGTRAGGVSLVALTWLVTAYILLSFMGHDIHTYYTMNLAPPLSLAIGLGAEALLASSSSVGRRNTIALGLGLSALVAWLTLGSLDTEGTSQTLGSTALVLGLMGALLTAVPPPKTWINRIAAGATITGLTIGPLATDLATVSRPQTGSSPLSGQVTISRNSMSQFMRGLEAGNPRWASDLALGALPPPSLTAQLGMDRRSCKWAAATFPAQSAANWQLALNAPVMPLGGFSAIDPSPTVERFKELARNGEVCDLIDYPEMNPILSNQPEISSIVAWVRTNYRDRIVDGITIYDLSSPL